jgi:hypothetical protein
MLLGTLPKEGDFTTLKIIRKMREDLSFSEDEHAQLNFRTTESGMAWNAAGDMPRDFSFGEKATDMIIAALKKLNAEKKLTEDHYSLYEKFVEA